MKNKVCHIYLFRHGQTFFNRDKIFTGWKDSKLTSLGRQQAKKIAMMLKHKKIDAAVHTGHSRSRDTLTIVLKFHPECHIIIEDNRMLERSYGKFEGMSHKSFIKKYGIDKFNKIHRGYDTVPQGGESVKMVETRVKSFIEDILAFIRKNHVSVAISASGNSMRPFRRHFEHLSIRQMMKLENPWDDYFEYKVKC